MNSRRVLLGDLLVQTKYCWGGGHTGVCARLGHYLCEDSSITHQHREYISVCACVCPNVSVMVYNGRFTPSQDSTNVHTLRLLSPFPPSPILPARLQLAWPEQVTSSLEVRVCVFTFSASHTHSVRCHSQGSGTDQRWDETDCVCVCVSLHER